MHLLLPSCATRMSNLIAAMFFGSISSSPEVDCKSEKRDRSWTNVSLSKLRLKIPDRRIEHRTPARTCSTISFAGIMNKIIVCAIKKLEEKLDTIICLSKLIGI